MIDGHGDDAFRYGTVIRHNFSTNIFMGIDHGSLIKHLADVAYKMKSYPEPEPKSTEKLIAGKHGIDHGAVIVTNGATEAIYLIAHLFHGEKSAIIAPTFREYQDACRIYRHEVSFVRSLDRIDGHKVTWMCNPNNPTGIVTDKNLLLERIDSNKDKIFVIDQAYADYTDHATLTAGEAAERNNVILLSSLTKRYAIPGLRVGYAIGNPQLINRLRGLRMPWSVNVLAIEAANYLLSQSASYTIDQRTLHNEALRIARSFNKMGITTTPTHCNFILCKLPDRPAADLKQYLVDRHGILIRDASNFEGLDKTYFRVAAQRPEENDMLIDAVEQWITSI